MLIGAAVYGTGVTARELAEEITQRIYYLPPPDRVPASEPIVERIQYVDVGNGRASPARRAADGSRNCRRRPRGQRDGAPRASIRSSTGAAGRDSVGGLVYSILNVEETAVRAEGSAAPIYPPELIEQAVEGAVLTNFVIDTTGRADTTTIEMLSATHPLFALSVRTAIPGMRFRRRWCRAARCARSWSSASSSASPRRGRAGASTRGQPGAVTARAAVRHRASSPASVPPRSPFSGRSAGTTSASGSRPIAPPTSRIRAPLAALVEEVDVRLASVAPEIVGDPKRSLFRIHRDVRFSNDKSPYKTHAACWFHHVDAGRGVGRDHGARRRGVLLPHGAGASVGGRRASGCRRAPRWRASASGSTRIRRPLARVLRAPALTRFGGLAEEAMLTRMPRGYDASHPAAALLRHQSFTVGRELTERELFGPRLPDLLARDYARILPLVRWLNGALGLRTLARR